MESECFYVVVVRMFEGLGKGDYAETSCALVGNALLLVQPSTGEIQKQMPPPANHVSGGLSVIFTTNRAEVKRCKALQVSRENIWDVQRYESKCAMLSSMLTSAKMRLESCCLSIRR